ncbi:MAG: hypothetical protein GQ564_10885 [Bacteroidales bacterium]|nr:hypothetical protein [Bacteroidales bacterium]
MKHSYYIFAFILTILFSNCSVLKKNTNNKLIFELETTSCYGTCPVYHLQIYSDGTALLNGKEHLDKIGNFKSTIEKEKLNELVTSFENASFFELKDAYQSKFLDLPTKYISYHKNGETKKIMAYDKIPKVVTGLITELKQLVDVLEWEKMD